MREPIPYPVYATRRPDGADLTVAKHHYEHLVRDLFDVLDERPELLEDLLALYADKPVAQDPHDIAQPDPADVLAERLVAALPVASRTIRLYRGPLSHLTDQLTAILGRRVWPIRQGRRAA
jgi:hypothetical protein